jgi:hypothetical protein
VLFAISAEDEKKPSDHPFIGQPSIHVEQLADYPIGSTSLILVAVRCSAYMYLHQLRVPRYSEEELLPTWVRPGSKCIEIERLERSG